MVGVGYRGFMALILQVIVIAKTVMEPLHHLLSLLNLSGGDEFGYLTAQTGRAADYALMILLQIILVSTRV